MTKNKILGYRDPRYKHKILSSQKVTKITKDTKSYKKLHDITITCRCFKQMDKELRVGKVLEKYEKSLKSRKNLRKVGKIK